ncbi:MAG: hypothetical protein E6R03_03915 [Hyphomicrobiaceae bacterium]|nr:MAG: hypothetical protein E6R03_03915 [Hyphomicrobiaceae bacterium]
MTRGRLIFPMTCRYEPLDTAATAAQDGGTGYDRDFREPIRRPDRTTSLTYGDPIEVECQVETEDDVQRLLDQQTHGDQSKSEVRLCFHFQDLEDQGLVDDNGRALIKNGDHLLALLDVDGNILDDYAQMDLVVTHAQPRSYGLSSLRRNLLLVTWSRRSRGP